MRAHILDQARVGRLLNAKGNQLAHLHRSISECSCGVEGYCLAASIMGTIPRGGMVDLAGGQEPDEQVSHFVGLDTTRRGLGLLITAR
jgi:hypothetical protein